MASVPIGVSLRPLQVEQVDRLAAREGVSRSAVIGRLIEQASERGNVPVVVVDGRRFVPAREKRS